MSASSSLSTSLLCCTITLLIACGDDSARDVAQADASGTGDTATAPDSNSDAGETDTSGSGAAPELSVRAVDSDGERLWIVGQVASGSDATTGLLDMDMGILVTDLEGIADSSFGDGGLAMISFGEGESTGGVSPRIQDGAYSVAVRPGGDSAVVAGFARGALSFSEADWGLAEIDASGELVTGFGESGLVRAEWTVDSRASALLLDAAGNAIGAGLIDQGGSRGTDLAFARWTNAGELDTSFGSTPGSAGTVIDRDANDDVVDAVLWGDSVVATTGFRFRTTRLTPEGAQDDAFGDRGWFQVDAGTAMAMAPLGGADDPILLVGTQRLPDTVGTSNERKGFRFVRVLPDGTLDESFGVVDYAPDIVTFENPRDGEVVYAGLGLVRGLVTDDDGGFLVYAEVTGFTALRGFLFRFDPTGRPVTSWGEDGRVELVAGAIPALAGLADLPTPHHMVRVGDRAYLADTLFRDDDTGGVESFVWIESFEL